MKLLVVCAVASLVLRCRGRVVRSPSSAIFEDILSWDSFIFCRMFESACRAGPELDLCLCSDFTQGRSLSNLDMIGDDDVGPGEIDLLCSDDRGISIFGPFSFIDRLRGLPKIPFLDFGFSLSVLSSEVDRAKLTPVTEDLAKDKLSMSFFMTASEEARGRDGVLVIGACAISGDIWTTVRSTSFDPWSAYSPALGAIVKPAF